MAAVAASRMPDSPSSSPRLPSPPPMPEFQFGPQSPSVAATTSELQVDAPSHPDETAQRRIRPGTKALDMAKGPPLVPLTQLDSAFQLQEHLKSLYAQYTHGQSASHIVPIVRDTALQIATPPQLSDGETVDKNLWLYELCRFLTMKANLVSVALMADTPPCSSITCPEMRASEWQYLCAVHEPPKSCCAIDYVNHTLDWAANVLTSTKHFPSRIQLGGETGNVFQSMRQLTNIFRRVYRIFAHAWFQHREVFWHIESTYGIYILFKTVCDKYQLIPEDNYTVPPEAEGSREDAETPVVNSSPEITATVQILKKDQPTSQNGSEQSTTETTTVSTGATTRRHKHTPSTGSHVATIAEGSEEEESEEQTQLPRQTYQAQSSTETSSTSPTQSSPTRPKPQNLGRLDIGSVAPYSIRNPEDPTPTTATSDKDPLSAARFVTPTSQSQSQPQSEPQPDTTDTDTDSAAPSTSQPDDQPSPPTTSDAGSGTGNVEVKVRRDSGLESEVRSPTGGSLRTAGTDMLSAILGHIEGYDGDSAKQSSETDAEKDEVNDEVNEKEKEKEKSADEAGESAVTTDLVETEVQVKVEEKEVKNDGEDDDDEVKPEEAVKAKEVVKEDDDDAETMEEIKIPS